MTKPVVVIYPRRLLLLWHGIFSGGVGMMLAWATLEGWSQDSLTDRGLAMTCISSPAAVFFISTSISFIWWAFSGMPCLEASEEYLKIRPTFPFWTHSVRWADVVAIDSLITVVRVVAYHNLRFRLRNGVDLEIEQSKIDCPIADVIFRLRTETGARHVRSFQSN